MIPIGFRYRLIDTAGGELGIVTYTTPRVVIGDRVHLPDGTLAGVVEVSDDEEHGQEGASPIITTGTGHASCAGAAVAADTRRLYSCDEESAQVRLRLAPVRGTS